GGSGLDRILYSTDGSTPSLLYTAPFTVASTATVKFDAYDRVGNLETTKSQLVQVDTTPPSTPILSFGSFTAASTAGTTVYYNPGGSGAFTVSASSTDAESGVASYSSPSLGSGWSNIGGAYSFAAGAAAPVGSN